MKKLLILFGLFSFALLAQAQVPGTLSYQGILVNNDGTPVTDGSHKVTFNFYETATAGTATFSRGEFTVTTYKGLFTFVIGTGTPITNTPLPVLSTDANYIGSVQYYVEIVADGVTLSPRVQLTSVPYAFQAANMDAAGLSGAIQVAGSNVGIGTSPTEKLDVAGTVKATNFIGDGSGLTNLPFGSGSSPWTASGNDITYASGNVGIGTTTPATTLQIGGYSTASDQYLTIATQGGNQFISGLKLRHFDTNYGWTIESDERLNYGGTSALLFRNHFNSADGDIKVAFLLNGNVGIGTEAPSEKLDVVGTIKATNFVGDGSGLTNLPGGGGSGSSPWAASGNDITYASGNVGIGTTAPRSRLDIASPGSEGSIFGIDQLVGLNDIRFYTDDLGSTPTMFLTGPGNLGIGTTTPHARIQTSNTIANRVAVLWEDFNNDHQYYGFGINGGTLRYQVANADASHKFYAGTSSTTSKELMRISGNGKVGIGTTNPDTKLQIGSYSTASDQYMTIATQGGNQFISGLKLRHFAPDNGWNIYSDERGSGPLGLHISVQHGATPSARMFIADGGNVGIGTTSPSQKLHVIGNILASGSITPSDLRLKENVANLNYGIKEIMNLRPVSYTMKDNPAQERNLGLIAQETLLITPEVVVSPQNEDEFYAMNYTQLIPVLIKAIQEQQEQIDELKSTNSELKNDLDQYQKLSAQVEILKKLIIENSVAVSHNSNIAETKNE